MRPREAPILALCLSQNVARSLAMHRAVRPVLMPWDEVNQAEAIDRALKELRDQSHLASGDTVVVISSVLAVESIADSIQMRVVD